MIALTFTDHFAPLFVFVIAWILIYAAVKTLKVPGDNRVHTILSLLVSIILVSSRNVVEYIYEVTPFLTLIMFISFIILIVLAFLAIKMDDFKKPLAWAALVIAIIVIIFFAFSHFTTLHSMLPESSDRGLDPNLREFKDFLYEDNTLRDNFVFIVCALAVGFFLFKVK